MTSSLLLEHFDDLLAVPEDVEILKRAILQLAVRGKLVEQDSQDEPANEMLNRVTGTKTRLKPFDNSELPKGWTWSCLQEVVQKDKHAIKRGPFGSAIKKAYFVPKGYKIYEQGNAIYKDFQRGDYYINEQKFQELKSFEVKPQDIIISCSGTVGKMAIVPEGIERGIINQALLKLSINQEALLNKYFEIILPAYIMQTDTLTDLKGTAIKNITSVKILRSLPFLLPPLAEQKRIVARVEELFAQTRALAQELAHSQIELDGLNKSALAHLLASETPPGEFNQHWEFIAEHFDLLFQTPEHVAPLRQSILELAVRGKLTRREAGDESAKELLKRIRDEKDKLGKKETFSPIKESEEPFALPDGWEWTRFGDITVNRDGERIPVAKEDRENRHGDYDYYGASGVIDKIEDYLFDKSLLLIGEDGANLVNRSTPIAFIAHGKYWVNNHAHVLDAIDFGTLKYLEVFINAIDLKPYLTGTAQPKMNQAKMNSIVVALPSLAEQERIVKRVEQLLSLCDALEARLQSAEEERGRLVRAVMSTVGG